MKLCLNICNEFFLLKFVCFFHFMKKFSEVETEKSGKMKETPRCGVSEVSGGNSYRLDLSECFFDREHSSLCIKQ